MSAATLATAGLAAAPAAGQDEEEVARLRALIEAFGGGEVPEEALTQMLTMYEAMGVDPSLILGAADPELLAALAGSELAFPKLEDGSGEADAGAELFAKITQDALNGEEFDEAAFMKVVLDATGGEEAFIKGEVAEALLDDTVVGFGIEPGEEASITICFPDVCKDAKITDPVVAEIVQQLLGERDPVRLQAILQILNS